MRLKPTHASLLPILTERCVVLAGRIDRTHGILTHVARFLTFESHVITEYILILAQIRFSVTCFAAVDAIAVGQHRQGTR